jgi:hypothetical protein
VPAINRQLRNCVPSWSRAPVQNRSVATNYSTVHTNLYLYSLFIYIYIYTVFVYIPSLLNPWFKHTYKIGNCIYTGSSRGDGSRDLKDYISIVQRERLNKLTTVLTKKYHVNFVTFNHHIMK